MAPVEEALPPPSLKGQGRQMALLLLLYFLQGLPMGLCSSLPLYLASQGASLTDQAIFSLASWPYSLKLLWAPVVDSLWTSRWRLGQRKSWVVPVQLFTGAVMIALGARIGDFLEPGSAGGGDHGVPPPGTASVNISALLAFFLFLYACCATQDIAVDGWALTLLRRENVGYASMANTVGQGCGVMAAYGLFIALDSADLCNRWIRTPLGMPPAEAGLVGMAGFLQGWGAVFILCTLAVWALQPEDPPPAEPAALLEEEGEGGECAGDVDGRDAAAAGADAGADAAGGGGRSAALAPLQMPSEQQRDSAGGSVGESAPQACHLRRRSGGSSGSSDCGGPGSAPAPALHAPGGGAPAPVSATVFSIDGFGAGHGSPVAGALGSHGAYGAVGAAGAAGDATHARAERGAKGSDAGDSEGEGDADAESAPLHCWHDGGGVAAPPPPHTAGAPASSGFAAARAAVRDAYRGFWKVARLPAVLSLAIVLVTVKATFSAADGALSLELTRRGMPRETIAAIDLLSFPLQLALQVGPLARISAGHRPLATFLAVFPLRVASCLLGLWLVYVALPDRSAHPWTASTVPWPAFATLFVVSNLQSAVANGMFMSQMAFFSRTASIDAVNGGSFMTLLNTLANLGAKWPAPLALLAVQAMTRSECLPQADAVQKAEGEGQLGWWSEASAASAAALTCDSAASRDACTALGGACRVTVPGYIPAVVLSAVYGAVWFWLMRKRVMRLQDEPPAAWLRAPAPGSPRRRAGAQEARSPAPTSSASVGDSAGAAAPEPHLTSRAGAAGVVAAEGGGFHSTWPPRAP